MALEIERKFLVQGSDWRQGAGLKLSQGYLSRDPARTVRVRIAGRQAYLTIKGLSQGEQMMSRPEFEYEIPMADAEALLKLCEGPVVEKLRRRIAVGGHVWDVDEFFGDNAGLVVAEVELQSEDQAFERPAWLGEEVTHEARYFNSNLAALPYKRWPDTAAAPL
jgi:adenylate cyclase